MEWKTVNFEPEGLACDSLQRDPKARPSAAELLVRVFGPLNDLQQPSHVLIF